jgi:hypothetical protein
MQGDTASNCARAARRLRRRAARDPASVALSRCEKYRDVTTIFLRKSSSFSSPQKVLISFRNRAQNSLSVAKIFF